MKKARRISNYIWENASLAKTTSKKSKSVEETSSQSGSISNHAYDNEDMCYGLWCEPRSNGNYETHNEIDAESKNANTNPILDLEPQELNQETLD